jgi:hypothetical protein
MEGESFGASMVPPKKRLALPLFYHKMPYSFETVKIVHCLKKLKNDAPTCGNK